MSTIENVRVLIVDDEPGMRLGAERVLRKTQATLSGLDVDVAFQCALAETGEEALDLLSAEKFDLLLLDYKLPGKSGLEVLEQIKLRNLDVTTVMMTAYASLEAAVSATKNGAYDFLSKPFSKEELESVVLKASAALVGARRVKQLADEKKRVRFEFISVLAHELKSPLSAVESYLQLMKDHMMGDAISDYDSIVERSISRIDGMRRLIFDLLDLTRIESGEKARTLVETDLAAILAAAVENVSIDAAKRHIEIQVNAPSSLLFLGDASELQIICNNLVSNAVKYNRDQGLVTIDLKLEDDLATLSVADTGIGIGKEDQARLFSTFSRIRNRKTENIQGSGLGLSILKKLVELYGGAITLTSEEDVGSTFVATLKKEHGRS